MKMQGDSSFPIDGHNVILNKLDSKTKTNGKRTNIENYKDPQQPLGPKVCHLGSTSKYSHVWNQFEGFYPVVLRAGCGI